jgi:diguanylate cyclase (GGDEF)-like protein
VIALAVATFAGAGAIAEGALAGMSWPLLAATLVVLASGIASMVRVGLMRPLAEVAVAELRRRLAAEATLEEIRSTDGLLAQVDEVLTMATSEADVLRVLGRAVSTLMPERDNSLLISSTTEPALAWQAHLNADGLDDPHPITGPGGCLALSNGHPAAVAATDQFDTCPHAALDDLVMSSVCVPILGADGPLGVVWSTGPAGDLPTDIESSALRRVVAAAGTRMVTVRNRPDPTADRDLRDPLTNLPNHVTARSSIRHLIESLTPFCLAVCNVDQLGDFNDRHGQDQGDRALTLVAHALRSTLRPSDIVCRYDGDTFVAIFPRCSALHAAAALERVREALVLGLAGAELGAVTASAGVADSNQGDSIDDILEMADIAMQVAKHEGGNRVRLASFDLEPEAGAELS